MKRIIPVIVFLSLANLSFAVSHVVTNAGNSFNPSNITITFGDSVLFSLASVHNVLEVDQTTYNANGNTPLVGGFSLPFGGGLLIPADLPIGTHYFVCQPHAIAGMKGIITVQDCTPAQPGPISGPTEVCENNVYTYSVAPVALATSYVWTLPSGWTGSSTSNSIMTTAITGSGNITVTASNSCGTSTPQTLAVTLFTTLPAAPTMINGPATVCQGSSHAYSVAADPLASSYSWFLPTGWTGNSTTSAINVVAGMNSGIISASANNACGTSAMVDLSVTVNGTALNPPGAIAGDSSLCSGETTIFSIDSVLGADSYLWTIPAGWTGVSDSTSIVVTTNNTGGVISVSAVDSCGSSAPTSLNISILIPDTSISVNGSTLTSNDTASGYQWLDCVNQMIIPLETNQSFTPVSNGTYAVILNLNGCADTSSCYTVNSLNVDVSEQPEIKIYPNPTTGLIYVDTFGIDFVKMELFDLSGRILLISESSEVLDLSPFNSGSYILKLSTKLSAYTLIVIKD